MKRELTGEMLVLKYYIHCIKNVIGFFREGKEMNKEIEAMRKATCEPVFILLTDNNEVIQEWGAHELRDSLMNALDDANNQLSWARCELDAFRRRVDRELKENAQLQVRLKELDDSIADGSLRWVD